MWKQIWEWLRGQFTLHQNTERNTEEIATLREQVNRLNTALQLMVGELDRLRDHEAQARESLYQKMRAEMLEQHNQELQERLRQLEERDRNRERDERRLPPPSS